MLPLRWESAAERGKAGRALSLADSIDVLLTAEFIFSAKRIGKMQWWAETALRISSKATGG